ARLAGQRRRPTATGISPSHSEPEALAPGALPFIRYRALTLPALITFAMARDNRYHGIVNGVSIIGDCNNSSASSYTCQETLAARRDRAPRRRPAPMRP